MKSLIFGDLILLLLLGVSNDTKTMFGWVDFREDGKKKGENEEENKIIEMFGLVERIDEKKTSRAQVSTKMFSLENWKDNHHRG